MRDGQGRRILIVDDDTEMLGVLRDVLSARWSITTARTASEALMAWTREDPDVIVLDLRLGGGSDGIDVFQDIRRRTGRRPPTVIISAADEAILAAEALHLPIVRKPFEIDALIAAIEQVLNEPSDRS